MKTELLAADQRSDPRVSCEHSAELLAADGTPFPVDLVNISAGGGQINLSTTAAAAIGLPSARTVQFRVWLPGDDEAAPLEGEARVAYLLPAEVGQDLVLGLEFRELVDDGLARLGSFVATILRYAE
jgi:hypothetical protein